jgi:hypothetical protein
MEFHDNGNLADNVLIELFQLFRGNPEFGVLNPADDFDGVTLNKFGIYFESSHVSSSAVTDVPIPRDLSGILLVHNGVEDRLLREARRKLGPPGPFDQFSLPRTHRAI